LSAPHVFTVAFINFESRISTNNAARLKPY
jgi:hypothetical protein